MNALSKSLIKLTIVSACFLILSSSKIYVSAYGNDKIDTETFSTSGDGSKNDYDYKRLIKKSISSIKSNYDYDEREDRDDRNMNHYVYTSSPDMTTIKTIEKKIRKGVVLDLAKEYIETSQKKYSIDLSEAEWTVLSNEDLIECNEGKCTVTKYPTNETTCLVRASSVLNLNDGGWRKVVVYFYLTPSKNTATMDKIRTIPPLSKDKLKISNNSAQNKSVKWESSNSKIASVSKNGSIQAKAKGKCEITATLSDGAKLKCTIIVPSDLEASLLSSLSGSYSGPNYYGDHTKYFFDIIITDNVIAGNPYKVTKLSKGDEEYTFYTKLYDRHSGKVIEDRTFTVHYDKRMIPLRILWFETSSPSWNFATLTE